MPTKKNVLADRRNATVIDKTKFKKKKSSYILNNINIDMDIKQMIFLA